MASAPADHAAVIDGVLVHALKRIADRRGAIMHMLRRDDPHFERFGEIYFSMVRPGVVKGWHLHRTMTLNYAVPSGEIRLVLYDARDGSPSRGQVQEIHLGGSDYALVRVPPGVWNAFLGLGDQPAIVANCATEPHDPGEIERIPPTSDRIPYDWGPISPDSG
jgi:dTDP-4-dehydrorhamnose 3,5-epimerase